MNWRKCPSASTKHTARSSSTVLVISSRFGGNIPIEDDPDGYDRLNGLFQFSIFSCSSRSGGASRSGGGRRSGGSRSGGGRRSGGS